MNVQKELNQIIDSTTGYTFGDITIKAQPIRGLKVAYAGGAKRGSGTVTGYIVIDSRYVEYGKDHRDEVLSIIRHELAHLIAETVNETKKRIWHGDAWKDICSAIGGDAERYYKGAFVKPENRGKTFMSKEEMRQTKPTQPADTWERGTYNQWLLRGYHVKRGEKGTPVMWEFKGEAYEGEDGKEENGYGKAYAVYFRNDQVEANV